MKDNRDPEQIGRSIAELRRAYNMSACDAADTLLSGLATPGEVANPHTGVRGSWSKQDSGPPRDFADYGPMLDGRPENGAQSGDGRYPSEYME